jgi:hypothetical protein
MFNINLNFHAILGCIISTEALLIKAKKKQQLNKFLKPYPLAGFEPRDLKLHSRDDDHNTTP